MSLEPQPRAHGIRWLLAIWVLASMAVAFHSHAPVDHDDDEACASCAAADAPLLTSPAAVCVEHATATVARVVVPTVSIVVTSPRLLPPTRAPPA